MALADTLDTVITYTVPDVALMLAEFVLAAVVAAYDKAPVVGVFVTAPAVIDDTVMEPEDTVTAGVP